MLDRHDAPAREAAAIATAINVKHDRHRQVSAPKEIGMQRVHLAVLDCARRGDQRLTKHLASEYLGCADVAALAAEQVVLDPLEIEQLQHFREARAVRHAFSRAARRRAARA